MDEKAILTLSLVPGVGNQRLRALLDHFNDPMDAFSASIAELNSIPSIDVRTSREIFHHTPDLSRIDALLGKLQRLGGKIISINNSEYPSYLKQIYDPPAFLYMLGSLVETDHDAIAVVGTRNPTPYGKMVTERLCNELIHSGFTIVSGLARGIDTVAHASAVQSGGRSVAVIGCGVDIVYPPDNINIHRQIRENGAILSEYHIGTKPEAGNFPKRNRIISGMTLGTVIIESSPKGGAMITASYALDQNREIFAVPGPILQEQNSGTNRLIQQGRAKLIQSVEDIIEEVGIKLKYITPVNIEHSAPLPPPDLNMFETKIFDALSTQPMYIDEIASRAELSTSDTLVHLLSLEFKGIVKQLAGKMFSRR